MQIETRDDFKIITMEVSSLEDASEQSMSLVYSIIEDLEESRNRVLEAFSADRVNGFRGTVFSIYHGDVFPDNFRGFGVIAWNQLVNVTPEAVRSSEFHKHVGSVRMMFGRIPEEEVGTSMTITQQAMSVLSDIMAERYSVETESYQIGAMFNE